MPPSDSYVVGIVNHQSYEDLARCILSLERQSIPPLWITVADHEPDAARARPIQARFPKVRWLCGPNSGFGAGANLIFAKARADERVPTAALILNPDIELAPQFAEQILAEMRHRPEVAIASGKLLRPGGTHFDSAGIVLPRHRRPRDRGSRRIDRGQYDRIERVFAVCGAAMMIRRTALDALAVDGEVFDESFFLYREDTDLCWRAGILGFTVLYVPTARAIHGRRWRRESHRSRLSVPVSVRRHSVKNHYLQLLKNERIASLVYHLPFILGFELLCLSYSLVIDRRVLSGYLAAWRLRHAAFAKRSAIFARAADRSRVVSSVQGRQAVGGGALRQQGDRVGWLRDA